MIRPRRLGKRGDAFMLTLDIIFLVAIILIFWKLSAAFTNPNSGEGLGTRQTAVLNTYAISEQMLLYLDEAAQFAAYEALAQTMESAKRIDSAGSTPCGTYAGYNLWATSGRLCFPPATLGERNDITAIFKKNMQAQLNRRLAFPGFPRINYLLDVRVENGITVYGIPDDEIVLPIVTAKGAAQTVTRNMVLKDNIIKAQQSSFGPDTKIPVRIDPSANRKARSAPPQYVVIHATKTANLQDAMASYKSGLASVHYVIDTDGQILQLVPENEMAMHMGACDEAPCYLGGKRLGADAIEQRSIGIALVNPGMSPDKDASDGKKCKDDTRYALLAPTNWCPSIKGAAGCTADTAKNCWAKYSPEQLSALEGLLTDIATRQSIKAEDIRLDEQIRVRSGEPGPALTAFEKNAPIEQGRWLAQLLKRVAEAAATAKAKPDAQTPVAPDAPIEPGLVVQLPLKSGEVSSCFGKRNLQSRGEDFHEGIDISASVGTPVYPIAEGTVMLAPVKSCAGACECSHVGSPRCNDACRRTCPASGNMLYIKHSNNLYSSYMHLKDVYVTQGQAVTRETQLGTVGNTGASEGPHLDLRVYLSDPTQADKKYANPFCIYPDSVLSKVTFQSAAKSCLQKQPNVPRYKTPFSSKDASLLEECKDIPSFTSAPECELNTIDASAANKKLASTLQNIQKAPGLPVVQDAAKQAGLSDYRLIIAVMAQESGADPTILNNHGFVGSGQFGAATASDRTVSAIFGSGISSACACPYPKKDSNGNIIVKTCHAAEIPGCNGDPRLDPEKSVRALAVYLQWNIDQFAGKKDQLRFGIASYNRGAGTIAAAIKKTGVDDPTWEQVAPHVALEGRNYVPAVMANYVALGGDATIAFQDQTCDGVSVKELGTYTFKPSFTVELPDLFTAFNRTVEWAQQTQKACDGVPKPGKPELEDPAACLEEQKAAFSRKWNDLDVRSCDGANESIVESFAEFIRDCRENYQDTCTCSWRPNIEGFTGKNLTIDIHGDEFQILADDVPLITQPAGLNTPASVRTGRYMFDGSSEVKPGGVRYVYLFEGGKLKTGYLEMGERSGDKKMWLSSADIAPITLYKSEVGIAYIADAKGVPACGEYKTMHRVCVGIKRPLYLLEKGETISPVIRFALELNDTQEPSAASIPQVTQPLQEDHLLVEFLPSKSPDISYYVVRCAPAGAGEMTGVDKMVVGRKDGKPVALSSIPEIRTCQGKPVQRGTLYKVEVTPVDLSGWPGEPTECNPDGAQIASFVGGIAKLYTGGWASLLSGAEKPEAAVTCPLEGFAKMEPAKP